MFRFSHRMSVCENKLGEVQTKQNKAEKLMIFKTNNLSKPKRRLRYRLILT